LKLLSQYSLCAVAYQVINLTIENEVEKMLYGNLGEGDWFNVSILN